MNLRVMNVAWAVEMQARLMALEQVVLATLDPVQRERWERQVEENRKVVEAAQLK